jgi:hypothetical protein
MTVAPGLVNVGTRATSTGHAVAVNRYLLDNRHP